MRNCDVCGSSFRVTDTNDLDNGYCFACGANWPMVSDRKRAEAAEARAAQLEIDNDDMQGYINEILVSLHTEKDELTIDAVRRIISERDELRNERDDYKVRMQSWHDSAMTLADQRDAAYRRNIDLETERDEWKETAENQNAHLELSRKDFMRRHRIVTRLWFNAKRERDELARQIAAAVTEEREACARVAIDLVFTEPFNIAAAIRARK